MKWLHLFKKKRTKCEASESDQCPDNALSDTCADQIHYQPKRRSLASAVCKAAVEKRTSLELWLEARKLRNSVERQCKTTTTDKLTVCKAGYTTLINKTYIVIKHLGSGTYGQVKLCFNIRDRKLYAVKSCRKSQFTPGIAGKSLRRHGFHGHRPASVDCAPTRIRSQEVIAKIKAEEFVREIAIMKKLSHPNIVRLLEVIDDPTTDSLLLAMEYVEGSTLQPKQIGCQIWEPVPESDVWKVVREVLQGLDYLHFNSVVHGDLKPANLLFDSTTGTVKIADFSSSIMHSERGTTTVFNLATAFCTPAFRSPESLFAGYKLSYELDMWSLGICIYMWVFGQLPYSGGASFVVYEKIKTQPLCFPANISISPELRNFLERLLEKDPSQRLTVVEAMHHPWVVANGAAPLPPISRHEILRREMEPLVTQEDIDEAICEVEGNVAELMDVLFQEVGFLNREEIIKVGDAVDTVYLIAEGEVEIYLDGSPESPGSPEHPIITGVAVDIAETQDPEFLDPAFLETHAPNSRELSSNYIDYIDFGAGSTIKRTSCKRGSSVNGQLVLAVKGPGESLGLTSLSQKPVQQPVWMASVRARGEVLAFKARVEDIRQLVLQHPEVEPAVNQIVVQQETDMMVAEAMRQLRIFNGTQRHKQQTLWV